MGTVLLDPDLVTGALGKNGEGGDVEAEFTRLCELSQAGAEGEEGVAGDGGGEVGDGELDVVDAGVVEPEDVAVAVFEGGDEGF